MHGPAMTTPKKQMEEPTKKKTFPAQKQSNKQTNKQTKKEKDSFIL